MRPSIERYHHIKATQGASEDASGARISGEPALVRYYCTMVRWCTNGAVHHGVERNQLWCNADIMQPAWCMTGAQRSADRVITYHWAPGGRSSYLA